MLAVTHNPGEHICLNLLLIVAESDAAMSLVVPRGCSALPRTASLQPLTMPPAAS